MKIFAVIAFAAILCLSNAGVSLPPKPTCSGGFTWSVSLKVCQKIKTPNPVTSVGESVVGSGSSNSFGPANTGIVIGNAGNAFGGINLFGLGGNANGIGGNAVEIGSESSGAGQLLHRPPPQSESSSSTGYASAMAKLSLDRR